MIKTAAANKRLLKLSWFCLIFTVFVILWGALVRATGSGAGCGSHWPLCNGETIPFEPSVKTMIEFTHRLTSGLVLLFILTLFIWTRCSKNISNAFKKTTLGSLVFILIEAAIGAVLVLMKLVENDSSALRAVVITIHLLNTFLLLGYLTSNVLVLKYDIKKLSFQRVLSHKHFFFGLILIMLVGASGALVALGDTLFPSTTLLEGIKNDFAEDSHFILRLRLIHPIIAVSTIIYLLWQVFENIMNLPKKSFLRISLMSLLKIQFILGFVNVYLMAPIWIQIVHLLLAQLIWISYFSAGMLNTYLQKKQH